MRNLLKFYIDGQGVKPTGSRTFDVTNPATEEIAGGISLGEKEAVNRAVIAARKKTSSTPCWGFNRTATSKMLCVSLTTPLMVLRLICLRARLNRLAPSVLEFESFRSTSMMTWICSTRQRPSRA
jgi:hypothetical protein